MKNSCIHLKNSTSNKLCYIIQRITILFLFQIRDHHKPVDQLALPHAHQPVSQSVVLHLHHLHHHHHQAHLAHQDHLDPQDHQDLTDHPDQEDHQEDQDPLDHPDLQEHQLDHQDPQEALDHSDPQEDQDHKDHPDHQDLQDHQDAQDPQLHHHHHHHAQLFALHNVCHHAHHHAAPRSTKCVPYRNFFIMMYTFLTLKVLGGKLIRNEVNEWI